MTESSNTQVRLQKRMAQLGIASRRESERLIAAGRVTVNGRVITTPGTKVTPNDTVALDGNDFEALLDPIVGVLHKPQGCVCARHDPQGRPTIYDHIPRDMPFLSHVGRLDFNTEGVLLMTTDGDMTQRLLRPGSGIGRTYEVKIRGRISRKQVMDLEAGIPLDGKPTKPVIVERIPQTESKHDWLSITLFEGKNRHVHRIIGAVGTSVTKLRRVTFGSVTLKGLPLGRFRLLDPSEVRELRTLVVK